METHEDYFSLLGLDMDEQVDQAALKKAYRAAARDAHPDSGGSNERFQAIRAAYDTLRDPELVDLYRAELALRMMRQRRAAGKVVPASDFVPYVLANIDPEGRYSRPARSSSSDPGTTGRTQGEQEDFEEAVARSAQEAVKRAAHNARVRRDGPDPDDIAAAHRRVAQERTERDAEDEVRRVARERLAHLRRGTWTSRLVGAVGGLLVAWVGLLLWSTGLPATLLGIAEGDALWLGAAHWQGGAFSSTLSSGVTVLGALAGAVVGSRLGALRRTHRIEAQELAAAATGLAVVAWALPWLTASLAAAGAVAVASVALSVLWLRIAVKRYLDTPQARALGLRVHHDRDAHSYRATLSEEAREEVLDDLYERHFEDGRQGL